jgi:hypothetical protein
VVDRRRDSTGWRALGVLRRRLGAASGTGFDGAKSDQTYETIHRRRAKGLAGQPCDPAHGIFTGDDRDGVRGAPNGRTVASQATARRRTRRDIGGIGGYRRSNGGTYRAAEGNGAGDDRAEDQLFGAGTGRADSSGGPGAAGGEELCGYGMRDFRCQGEVGG